MLVVYTDGSSALREPGVKAAGGTDARKVLGKALARGVGVVVTAGHQKRAARASIPREDVAAVLALGRVQDPVLGEIVWDSGSDDDDGVWRFEAGPVRGRSVAGVVVPRTEWGPLPPRSMPRIRRTVRWVRENDPAIRGHMAAEMWDWWYNEYCDPPDRDTVSSPEHFRDTLELEVIRFEPDRDAFLDYADHGLVCNFGIRISVGPDGRFTGGPEIC